METYILGDSERRERNAQAIRDQHLSGLLCAMPSDVLMATGGYWPVVGSSFALAGANGRVAVVVPQDERELVEPFDGIEVQTFQPASLEDLRTEQDVVWKALRDAAAMIGISTGQIGCESGAAFEPAPYASMHRFKSSLQEILSRALPNCTPVDADEFLVRLRSVCTRSEVQRIRHSCRAAKPAFASAHHELRPGVTENLAASRMRPPLYLDADGRDMQHLAIMSGARSAKAFGAYAISSEKRLAEHELVLVHCNSNIGGYWTDITRTFCLGEPTDEQHRMYQAVSAARQAALDAIRPGVHAADVDKAARQVLGDLGFAKQFKHSTGHGVGFSAIDHNARPRLHPKSPDVLQAGMVFNVEPAIYLDKSQGMRHCDVVTVTETGVEVLTPFLAGSDDLVIAG